MGATSTGEPRPGAGPTPGPPVDRTRSTRRAFATVVLGFEALVVLFAGLVAKDLSPLSPAAALGASAALAVLCLLAAGLLRGPVGYPVGWVVQVLLVAGGFWVGMMFVLGALFAGLWVAALRIGGRIDRERAGFHGPVRRDGRPRPGH